MKIYKHKSGLIKQVGGRWSWKAFLFGPLYFWYKGLVLEGFLLLLLGVVSMMFYAVPLAWIISGLWLNIAYEEKLIKDGFVLVV